MCECVRFVMKNFDMMDLGVGTNMRDSFPLLSEDEGLDPS